MVRKHTQSLPGHICFRTAGFCFFPNISDLDPGVYRNELFYFGALLSLPDQYRIMAVSPLRKAFIKNPSLRWLVLLLTGIVLAANYYFYDAFSTLKDLLQEEFGFTNTDYGLFVSFYSVPNTFLLMAVLGGIILDKLGIRRTGFLFVFFMAFGAVLTAYGASDQYRDGGLGYAFMQSFLPSYSPELKMMLLGRLFYGLGAETSIVVVSKVLVKWFKGKNLGLAFGLKVGFARLGTFMALRMSPRMAEGGEELTFAIWVAALFVCLGLLVFIVYMLFDLAKDREENRDVEKKISTKNEFKWSDLGTVIKNPAYLYIALLCVTFYSAVFPFLAYAPDFLSDRYALTAVESGDLTSFLPLATAFFTPLFGFMIDRYGRSITAMGIGSLLLVAIHLSFAFTYIPPIIPVMVLGVVFSLVPAALWPTMVKLVPEKSIGTAYGLTYSIQNLGLWAFPILAGWLLDKYNPGNPEVLDYTQVLLMFAALGLAGLLFSFLLYRTDKKNGMGVNRPLNRVE